MPLRAWFRLNVSCRKALSPPELPLSLLFMQPHVPFPWLLWSFIRCLPVKKRRFLRPAGRLCSIFGRFCRHIPKDVMKSAGPFFLAVIQFVSLARVWKTAGGSCGSITNPCFDIQDLLRKIRRRFLLKRLRYNTVFSYRKGQGLSCGSPIWLVPSSIIFLMRIMRCTALSAWVWMRSSAAQASRWMGVA